MGRTDGRNIDQLIGLCGGIVADGHLSDEEIFALKDWMKRNWALRDEWPANVLFARINAALSDGNIDDIERRELLKTVAQIGTGALPVYEQSKSGVIELPVDDPPPLVVFGGKGFVITGNFVIGSRSAIEHMITIRGGSVHSACKTTTDYVVMGLLGSKEWKHTGFGTKIKAAMTLRSKGGRVAIISESHFANALKEPFDAPGA